MYVLVRPGAIAFMEALSEYFEIVIFTASLSKYADPLMDILDQGDWCSHRLFREHCSFYNSIFVKDMAVLGRPLKDIIIIDNSPSSYLFQPENALPSISWYESQEDKQLFDFIPLLRELSKVEDVRPFLHGCTKENVLDINKCMMMMETYFE